MAKKNRIVLRSEFPAVKEAAWETVQKAREEWLDVAARTAEEKAQSGAATHGYGGLQIGIEKEKIGHQSARIWPVTHSTKWGDDPWFLRFFEYGAVHITAMPFMRPAERKAKKAFLEVMGDDLEGTIRRRTRRVR
jgi:HK97 gp10 family phage protein